MGPPAMTRRLDLFKSSKHLTLYINIFKEVGAPLRGSCPDGTRPARGGGGASPARGGTGPFGTGPPFSRTSERSPYIYRGSSLPSRAPLTGRGAPKGIVASTRKQRRSREIFLYIVIFHGI